MKNTLSSLYKQHKVAVAGGIWVLLFFICVKSLHAFHLEGWQKVGITLLPGLPFAFFIITGISEIRSCDEFTKQLHLEALAIAFPLSLLLLMIRTLLENAYLLPQGDNWDFGNVWLYLCLLYFIGLAMAWRRYR